VNETGLVLATLVVYNAVLVGIGLWARGRNRSVEDFYLAGRRLGPWVAAISASASSSSAWTLLGVSGAAYAWGLPALWLFPATVGGFLVNWVWVAPRLSALPNSASVSGVMKAFVPGTPQPRTPTCSRASWSSASYDEVSSRSGDAIHGRRPCSNAGSLVSAVRC
jgi:sodium/proline symporter